MRPENAYSLALSRETTEPASIVATAAGATNSLLFIVDGHSAKRFLVDTGAAVSVYPASLRDIIGGSHTRSLVAANGSNIATYGTRIMNIRLENHDYTRAFILADVKTPLLGADCLQANWLLVDLQCYVICEFDAKAVQPNFTRSSPRHVGRSVLTFTWTVPNDHPRLEFSSKSVWHGVEHFVQTEGPPVQARARRMPPDKLVIAKWEFRNMEDMGIIRRSDSPWSSPLHIVPNNSGGWRACCDYRRLNDVTTADRYPVPHIQDFASQLAGVSVFSKIDLVRGYHQIPVAADDVSKTAVITPFGLFEFLRTSFGLKNAAQAFKRFMDTVSTHGLVNNVSKCQFGATTIDYLGHQITSQWAIPLPAKVEAIRTVARPTTIKGLQQFGGMLNCYHWFIPNAAQIMRPIYDALAGKPMTLKWSGELDEAFTTANEALAQATMLVNPHADNPTALTVDASGTAVGAVLDQNSDRSDWKPVAFFSRKLRHAEQNYSAFDRELLAAYLAIRHHRYFLEGRSFTLFTYHKPLTFAISKICDPWSPRQQRHLAYVSEFTTDVRHIEGKANTVADTLSGGELSAIAHFSLAWTIMRWQQLSVQTRVSQPSRQPPLDLLPGTYRWTTTATRSRVTYPLAEPDHSSQTRSNAPCLMMYTTSPTRQSEQRNNWSRLSLYGLAYGSKSASGRKLVCVVKRPKYIDTIPPQWTILCLRHAVSFTSTST